METLEQQFSSRLSAFLRRTGLRPTTFGMKALDDPNLVRQDRPRTLAVAQDGGPGARIHGRVRPGSVRREGPAPAQAGPQAFVTCEENEEAKQSDDGTTDGTDNESADLHSAAAGGAGPHRPVAEHDLCAAEPGALPPPYGRPTV